MLPGPNRSRGQRYAHALVAISQDSLTPPSGDAAPSGSGTPVIAALVDLDEADAIRVADLRQMSATLGRLRSSTPARTPREWAPRRAAAGVEAVEPAQRLRGRPAWPPSRREILVSRQARERYAIDGRDLSPEGTLLVEDLTRVRDLAERINAHRDLEHHRETGHRLHLVPDDVDALPLDARFARADRLFADVYTY